MDLFPTMNKSRAVAILTASAGKSAGREILGDSEKINDFIWSILEDTAAEPSISAILVFSPFISVSIYKYLRF